MRDLRLIGVHDDGEHLVVTDDATGEEFRLRIDEPLRAAARRDRPRLGQLQIAIDNDVRPREVQAMIRAGATADEVSARTGWDLEKIARFEGPVLAEREHVAERAQAVRMRGANQAGDPETLGDRARSRFAGRGVESSSVQWDARRNAEGQWTVSASFLAGGRERNATWWFDVPGMSVVAKNDEAKWLSEAETPTGPVPAAVHRPTAVFDVEVEETRAERANRADPDELIASMREHSGARSRRRGGRRRGRPAEDVPPEDALPFEAGDEQPPAARGPHPKDGAGDEPPETDVSPEVATAPRTQAQPSGEPTPDQAADPTVKDEPTKDKATKDEPTRDKATKGKASKSEPTKRGQSEDVRTKDTSTSGDDATREAREAADPAPDSSGGPQASAPARDEDRPTRDTEPPAADNETSPDEDRTGSGRAAGSESRDAVTDEADPSDPSDPSDASGTSSSSSSDKKSKSARGRNRKGRASVPSWDDVMFGTTRD